MIKREYKTVKERLFWSYANLALAHTAVERKQDKYAAFNYMIRARLFKGLIDGTMNIRTLFDDEKIKLFTVKTTDIVSGGAWGRRPHTLSEPTMLVSKV